MQLRSVIFGLFDLEMASNESWCFLIEKISSLLCQNRDRHWAVE
jgi:hypothetical protein